MKGQKGGQNGHLNTRRSQEIPHKTPAQTRIHSPRFPTEFPRPTPPYPTRSPPRLRFRTPVEPRLHSSYSFKYFRIAGLSLPKASIWVPPTPYLGPRYPPSQTEVYGLTVGYLQKTPAQQNF